MHMKFHRSICWSILGAAIVLLAPGCRSLHSEPHNAGTGTRLYQEGGQLYGAYLEGDQEHARQALLGLVQLGEQDRKSSPSVQSLQLSRAYLWLFVFEQRVGDQDLAKVAFAKAKYWRIRRAELSGQTDAEIGPLLSTFTEQRCVADVDAWDKAHNSGKAPRYVLDLSSAPAHPNPAPAPAPKS